MLVIRIARCNVKRPAVVARINDIPEVTTHGTLLVVGPEVSAPCHRQVHQLELQRGPSAPGTVEAVSNQVERESTEIHTPKFTRKRATDWQSRRAGRCIWRGYGRLPSRKLRGSAAESVLLCD